VAVDIKFDQLRPGHRPPSDDESSAWEGRQQLIDADSLPNPATLDNRNWRHLVAGVLVADNRG